ncbi:MAG: ribonuclease HII [bacterium]
MPRRIPKNLVPLPGLHRTPMQPSEPGAPFGSELELWDEGMIVIGIDEAGRGPLAGPVVAAAVCFDSSVRIEGVGDSKVLSRRRREELDTLIREKALAYAIEESTHLRIDEINILEATREAMARAAKRVRELMGSAHPVLLVDGRIPGLGIGRQINLVKGDSLSFSIGAASILAKVHRDRLMVDFDSLWPLYGFARHKGYPTVEHRHALMEHGFCPIHRGTFTIEVRGQRMPIGDLKGTPR